jgi:hypothetical protein
MRSVSDLSGTQISKFIAYKRFPYLRKYPQPNLFGPPLHKLPPQVVPQLGELVPKILP